MLVISLLFLNYIQIGYTCFIKQTVNIPLNKLLTISEWNTTLNRLFTNSMEKENCFLSVTLNFHRTDLIINIDQEFSFDPKCDHVTVYNNFIFANSTNITNTIYHRCWTSPMCDRDFLLAFVNPEWLFILMNDHQDLALELKKILVVYSEQTLTEIDCFQGSSSTECETGTNTCTLLYNSEGTTRRCGPTEPARPEFHMYSFIDQKNGFDLSRRYYFRCNFFLCNSVDKFKDVKTVIFNQYKLPETLHPWPQLSTLLTSTTLPSSISGINMTNESKETIPRIPSTIKQTTTILTSTTSTPTKSKTERSTTKKSTVKQTTTSSTTKQSTILTSTSVVQKSTTTPEIIEPDLSTISDMYIKSTTNMSFSQSTMLNKSRKIFHYSILINIFFCYFLIDIALIN